MKLVSRHINTLRFNVISLIVRIYYICIEVFTYTFNSVLEKVINNNYGKKVIKEET